LNQPATFRITLDAFDGFVYSLAVPTVAVETCLRLPNAERLVNTRSYPVNINHFRLVRNTELPKSFMFWRIPAMAYCFN
jgi:hypothetical protein